MSHDEQKPGVSGEKRPEQPNEIETTEGSAAPYLIAFVVMLLVFIVYGYLSKP